MAQKIDNQTYFNQNRTVSWNNPPIVVAWKFSSAENLGALLRVCDNFGVKQVFFVGNEVDYKSSKIKRNATTSFNKVEWCFVSENDITFLADFSQNSKNKLLDFAGRLAVNKEGIPIYNFGKHKDIFLHHFTYIALKSEYW